jgi:hypothetical protein
VERVVGIGPLLKWKRGPGIAISLRLDCHGEALSLGAAFVESAIEVSIPASLLAGLTKILAEIGSAGS